MKRIDIIAFAFFLLNLKVLTIMNAMHNFISGQRFFIPMLKIERKDYIRMVKETLKFSYVPAYFELESSRTNPLTL